MMFTLKTFHFKDRKHNYLLLGMNNDFMNTKNSHIVHYRKHSVMYNVTFTFVTSATGG